MTTRPTADELSRKMAADTAAVVRERVALAERRASYELRARVAQTQPQAEPADDYGHPEAAVVWLGIAACFALGGPLTFVCLPWALVAQTLPAVAGAATGVTLLLLGVAAAGRMVTRK